jgi:hypothetical protein
MQDVKASRCLDLIFLDLNYFAKVLYVNYERLVNGRGFSREVWIYPANYEQDGPARIVSYSLNLVIEISYWVSRAPI